MGYAGSDDDWAEYLAEQDMTPATLRVKTIRQLIIDELVEKKAATLGLVIAEDEVEAYVQNMKDSLAFGDDEIFAETLAMYGRTEDDIREMYTHELFEQALYKDQVEVPEPTDEEVSNYIAVTYPTGITTKHVYYLTVDGLDEGSSYDNLANVQQIRASLLEAGVTEETFASCVTMFCSDEDLISRNGANGWDLDMSDLNSNYQTAVENTEVGEVSDVFVDDNGYSFVWIDTSFTLPDLTDVAAGELSVDDYLGDMPSSLKDYFADCTAQQLWEADCQTYLEELYNGSNPVLYGMPAGLSYDVDMSAYTEDESEEATGSEDKDTADADSSDDTAASDGGEEDVADDAEE